MYPGRNQEVLKVKKSILGSIQIYPIILSCIAIFKKTALYSHSTTFATAILHYGELSAVIWLQESDLYCFQKSYFNSFYLGCSKT